MVCLAPVTRRHWPRVSNLTHLSLSNPDNEDCAFATNVRGGQLVVYRESQVLMRRENIPPYR